MNKFWKIQNSVDSKGSELILEGVVASESWFGDEITPQAFRDELKNITGDLTVVLNSPGGDVFAGVQIYNALKNLDVNVTVRVDGMAASIASIIAMAGDKIIMSPGSLMMVHKPSMMAWGDENEMEKAKEFLGKIEDEMLPIYVARTGLSLEKVTELVSAETWMSGAEAVELGFADEVIEAKTSVGDTVKAMLSGKLAFSMEATKESIENALEKQSTDAPEAKVKPEAKQTNKPKENTMTEAEMRAKIESETLAASEAEAKLQSQIETSVEAIVAKALPKQEVTVSATAEAYLKTDEAMEKFAAILQANPGERGGDSAEKVHDAWKEHLVTMGVTNPGFLLPTPLVTEIEDAFKRGGEIFNLVNWTGLDAYNTTWDTIGYVEDGRGKGYNRSVQEAKQEELITLAGRIIRPQFVYKYITLNKEDVKAQRSTGALVRYVLSELPRRIIREIERAIVIGDGRANGTAFKINESSNGGFFSIKTDAVGSTGLAVAYTPTVLAPQYDTLVTATALALADGSKYLIAKTSFLTSLRLMKSNGMYVFPPGTNLAEALGFAGIITPDWFTDATDTVNDAYILTQGAYKGVGDRSVEAFQNFILSTNKNEYLQELWAGGGLSQIASAVAIKKTPQV